MNNNFNFNFRINILIKMINEIIFDLNNKTNKYLFTNFSWFNNELIILIYNNKGNSNLNFKTIPPDDCFIIDLTLKNNETLSNLEELKKYLLTLKQ